MIEVQWAPVGSDAAVARYLAEKIASGARHLGVPGGKTPVGIIDRLTTFDLPWHELRIDLVDDRIVPVDHPASNFGILSRAFAGKPVQLAPLSDGPWTGGRFDLVWLGMGEDGHIASIFPGSAPSPELPPTVVAVMPDPLPPEAPFERLTLTLSALTDAEEIILVVRGQQKRDILESVIAGRRGLPIADLLAAARSPVSIFWTE